MTKEAARKYGLYDTQDDCWLGDDYGPRTFADFALARMAAQICETQLCGSDLGGRIVAREIDDTALHLKDELPLKHSALKAIRRIETQ